MTGKSLSRHLNQKNLIFSAACKACLNVEDGRNDQWIGSSDAATPSAGSE